MNDMADLEHEIVELKQYFKHHRIVTYVMLAFIVLSSVMVSSSLQSLNQQQSVQSRASEGACPVQQFKFGENSCMGGQAKGMYVRCKPGDGLKLIECGRSGISGNILQCCDVRSQGFQDKVKHYCGCVPPTATPVPTAVPTPTTYVEPTQTPNCGVSCFVTDPIDRQPCVGGTTCQKLPCRGGNCPGEEGRCWGVMCPLPTVTPTTRPTSSMPEVPPGCRLAPVCNNAWPRIGCTSTEVCVNGMYCCSGGANRQQSQNGTGNDQATTGNGYSQ